MLIFWIAADVWRAARRDGAVLRAFAFFTLTTGVTMQWYVVANYLDLAGLLAAGEAMRWLGLGVWLPMIAATIYLRRSLG